ncbi:MAG TPA: ATP-binding protein [Streptosporangiaceae bacterium]|nr:ATP-binding protein [Streptosporangiaceae bacterium]
MTTTDWPLSSYLELGALASAVPCARLHARQVLWEWGLAVLTDTVGLVVSELVTNGIQASAGVIGSWYQGQWAAGIPPVRLWLCSDREKVLVEVWDGNEQKPQTQEVDLEADGGRGLLLVETLCAEWGTYMPENSTGKCVWAVVTKRNRL